MNLESCDKPVIKIPYVAQGDRLDTSKNEILRNLSAKTLYPRHNNSSIKEPTHGLPTIHRTLPAMQIFINIRRTSISQSHDVSPSFKNHLTIAVVILF
ncbi:hypothetical protein RYX36_031034 [Vicia faba]